MNDIVKEIWERNKEFMSSLNSLKTVRKNRMINLILVGLFILAFIGIICIFIYLFASFEETLVWKNILICIILLFVFALLSISLYSIFRRDRFDKEVEKEVMLKCVELEKSIINSSFNHLEQTQRINCLQKEKEELEKKYKELIKNSEEYSKYKFQNEELVETKKKYEKLNEDIEKHFFENMFNVNKILEMYINLRDEKSK